MNLPVEVIDAVSARRCLVVVGSHVTAEAAAAVQRPFPLGKALAKALGWRRPRLLPGQRARFVAPSVCDGAEALAASEGRATMEQRLKELLGGEGLEPTDVHRFLLEHCPVILSTSWDDLLERCADEQGIGMTSVSRSEDLPDELGPGPCLVKLCNRFDGQPIVTRDDRVRSPLTEAFQRRTRTLLRDNTVLFLGYRPDEEEFELVWEDLTRCFGGELPRCHLAVAQGQIDDVQWQRWVWRGVLLFMADPIEVVETLRKEVAD